MHSFTGDQALGTCTPQWCFWSVRGLGLREIVNATIPPHMNSESSRAFGSTGTHLRSLNIWAVVLPTDVSSIGGLQRNVGQPLIYATLLCACAAL